VIVITGEAVASLIRSSVLAVKRPLKLDHYGPTLSGMRTMLTYTREARRETLHRWLVLVADQPGKEKWLVEVAGVGLEMTPQIAAAMRAGIEEQLEELETDAFMVTGAG
jgi:hypothetical protein